MGKRNIQSGLTQKKLVYAFPPKMWLFQDLHPILLQSSGSLFFTQRSTRRWHSSWTQRTVQLHVLHLQKKLMDLDTNIFWTSGLEGFFILRPETSCCKSMVDHVSATTSPSTVNIIWLVVLSMFYFLQDVCKCGWYVSIGKTTTNQIPLNFTNGTHGTFGVKKTRPHGDLSSILTRTWTIPWSVVQRWCLGI